MLNAGDIAIIGIKTELSDDFAFVALTDIAAGETVRFTDNGVNADGTFDSIEGVVEWTAPEGGIAAGAVVRYAGNADFATVSGFFALSTSGDQLIAYQGDEAAPSFLYAVQTNSTVWQADAANAWTSALPAGLVEGETAVAVGAGSGAGDEWDSAAYAGPTVGTLAELTAAIADAANWTGTNDAAEAEAVAAAMPEGFSFIIGAEGSFDLQITEIWMGNASGSNLTADWFEVTNKGTASWVASVHGDLFFDDESADAAAADKLNGVTVIAPGESVVFVDDDSVDEFLALWSDRLDLSSTQIGTYAGAGLGGGGDAVTLFIDNGAQGDDALDDAAQLDYEAYPDADAAAGASWDVDAQAFSQAGTDGAVETFVSNDEGEHVIGSPGNAPALPTPASAFTLELLHFSDQEAAGAAIVDAPNLSGVLNALRAQDLGEDGIADNTLTLSSGDAMIPGLFFDASTGVYGAGGIADILIQNELGVQAMALGNHEFDKGSEILAGLIDGSAAEGFDGAAFPYLSSNIDFSADPYLAGLVTAGGQAPMANVIASSTVLETGGEMIGVVGATTPTLNFISSPDGVSMWPTEFDATPTDAQLDALAAVIQAEVEALLSANPGMNKVVLLAHMQRIDIEFALAERLTDVDIIVAGGSNTRLFDDNDAMRDGDSDQGQYPAFIKDADGNWTAVVNTDGSYKYVGRLVIDFDENGHIIADSYDEDVSGAYATDAAGLAAVGGEALIDPEIQAIADAVEAEIIASESNVFGVSDVFLNGNRSGVYADPADVDGVRTQETNLGNLTADANLAAAQAVDGSVVVSIKNGGGVRASIGETVVPAGGTEYIRQANGEVVDGDGNIVKPEGGISQNDIASALAFNNGLSLLSLTTAELVAVLEHGISSLPGVAGMFPQVSGIKFSFDESLPAGSRIVNAGIFAEDGALIAKLVEDGAIVDNGATAFRVVTLNFMAGGGDGYPFDLAANPDRVDLYDLDGDGEDDGALTGVATFAEDGSEQDALAEYLAANFLDAAYAEEDTDRTEDERIQNLAFREDAVFAGVVETPSLWINEVDADNPSTDTVEFVELWDGGAGSTDLTGFSLVLINGSNDTVYNAIDLDGYSTDENGFFVIGSALVANVDLVAWVSNGIQNGQDAVALVQGDAADFAGQLITDILDGDGLLNGLVDGLVYDTNDSDDAALLAALGQDAQINEAENGDSTADSVSRSPDGGDWVVQTPTPGATNEIPLSPAAPAPAGAESLSATHLGTIALAGAEIVDFDAATGYAFVTSGTGLQIVDVNDPSAPVLVSTLLPSVDAGLSDAITSTSVKNGIVAAAVPSGVVGVNGHVVFYSTAGVYLGSVEVGDLPDMVTFNEDGTYLLTANEAQSAGGDNEPDVLPNPVGSVSIVAINAGDLSASTVSTFDFSSLDGDAAALKAKGVRLDDSAPSVGADIEPEYITLSGNTAYVALQENNAYAIIEDITAFTGFTIDDIVTAGTTDHSIFGNGFDASNRDDGINIYQHDVMGLRMPDGIAAFTVGGVTYFASANEGDGRGVDEIRGADLEASGLLDAALLAEMGDRLADEADLGRLKFSATSGDTDGDGDIDVLHSFGSRSFTIYDADGNEIFDSGDLIERIVAAEAPELFNSDESDPAEFDSRSDDKGPEPEAVEFGEVNGTPYLFVGLERTGGVMAFDISDPTNPVYDRWIKVDGDVAPEGLQFISAEDSPTGAPLLAVANEVSGTLSFVELAPAVVEYDMIHDIQGSTSFAGSIGTVGVDDVSPYVGQTVTIQAVVTADLQDGGAMDDMNGFYVQEEDADADGDASTSEGIFIYDPSTLVDVSVGDLVTITGTVSEYFGLTQITVDAVSVVETGVALPTATVVEFPTAGIMNDGDGGYIADLEAYEGMLVTIPTELTVAELFNLDRYGEYVATVGRFEQFTQSNTPDAAGYEAFLQELGASKITLDDGYAGQNPAQLEVIDGNDGILSNTDTFSMGDTLTDVTGVAGYSYDLFRIYNPTGTYADTEVRAETPDAVDGFKVASLNVLNYFTTIDTGAANSGPNDDMDARGADSAEEFARQQAKIVDAILAMDADVLGLMEIENDDDIALADLVDAVNAALGYTAYGYIATGDLGGDAITQALMYKLETAAPVGDFAALTEHAGQNFLDPLGAGTDLNRPALAQTFQDLATGTMLTVAVNHLKSKGSLSGLAADADQGDGAGNNNATRAAAAQILADWLASDPTGTGAENQLIIGDLNSYAQEDPLQVLAAAGFTDLADALIEDAYSYVFDGQIGTLDYALANAALLSDVAGVTEWHINSNEADAFDYNLDYGRDAALYDGSTAARNSDHDPVIVTFNFADQPIAGDDVLVATGEADIFDISSGGTDLLTGTELTLNGDQLLGMSTGDAILFEGMSFTASDVSFDGRFLSVGAATIDLGGDLPAGMFSVSAEAGGTQLTFEERPVVAEIQQIQLTDAVSTITLDHSFLNPVVFALAVGVNEAEPVSVRVIEAAGDQVTLKLQEPLGQDGVHGTENVTLFVVEEGVHTLADGTIIEAGELSTNLMSPTWQFEQVGFSGGFASGPSIFSQVQTNNGTDYVVTRQFDASETGFKVALQEEEQAGLSTHAVETVGWFAMSQGQGSASGIDFEADTIEFGVNGNHGGDSFASAFDAAPNVLANVSTIVGHDHVVTRLAAVDEFGFEVRAQEDASFDAETNHARESVDWVAFGAEGLIFADDLEQNFVFDAIV